MKDSRLLPEGKKFAKPVPRYVEEEAVKKRQNDDHCEGYPWYSLVSGAAWPQHHVTVHRDDKAARCTAG